MRATAIATPYRHLMLAPVRWNASTLTEMYFRSSQFAATHTRSSQAARLAACVCMLLLGLLLFVQSVHVHPAGSNPDQCPICVAMHSAAPVRTHAAVRMVRWHRDLVVSPRQSAPATALHCTLYKRPPPTVSA